MSPNWPKPPAVPRNPASQAIADSRNRDAKRVQSGRSIWGLNRSGLRVDDELELVQRAVAGERLALERLLLRHHRTLSARIAAGLPAALRSTLAAEDVLQDVFTEAYRGIAAFRPTDAGSFIRWLCTIADHRVVDAARAQRAAKRGGGRSPVAADEYESLRGLLDLVAVHERTPSQSAAGHEAVAAVRNALQSISPDYRTALELRYLHGLSVGDTAARMGRTERAVHKLCSRGLGQLRDVLGDAATYLTRK